MSVPVLLIDVLTRPAAISGLGALDWDLLVRQARRANLLARLAVVLAAAGCLDKVPEAPRQHLDSALRMVERQAVAMRWEVECIRQALATVGVPVILLKGAAYLMRGLPVARGRAFSDVDVLVPRERIVATESALLIHGWRGSHENAHDQRYYREWMHEIPPMTHVLRGTAIDVHHSILPLIARIRVAMPLLFAAAEPLPDCPGVLVLNPTDMLLHSATHLFHEGELGNGLRDLFDLDCMLRDFAGRPGFWGGLVPRARALGLERPLYYAIRYTTMLLGTPVPADIVDAAQVGAPPAAVGALVDFCYRRALLPEHASCSDATTGAARFALYLRSHWIRMPTHLLVYHLAHKALRRPAREAAADTPPTDQGKAG